MCGRHDLTGIYLTGIAITNIVITGIVLKEKTTFARESARRAGWDAGARAERGAINLGTSE